MTKIYFPEDQQIQVHQSRIQHCPPSLPVGFYWYGNKRTRPGRPPKHVLNHLAAIQADMHKSTGTIDYNQSLQAETLEGDETSNHSESIKTDDQQTNHQDQDKCPYSLTSQKTKKKMLGSSSFKGGMM